MLYCDESVVSQYYLSYYFMYFEYYERSFCIPLPQKGQN